MTTPQLNVLQLKKSKSVSHYCHIIHSLPHVDIYEIFALDYFDSVLLNSPIHIDFIRDVEKKRKLKAKQLEITGCSYLDVLESKLKNTQIQQFFHNNKKTLLIAPSWGRNALLAKYGQALIESLKDSPFNIIIRPHPQSLKTEQKMLNKLKTISSDIFWDENIDNIHALANCDIMLGDFSGVIFDFICLFKKPVCVLEFNFNIIGYDLEDIKNEPWISEILPTIGRMIKENEINNLSNIVSQTLESKYYAHNVENLTNLLWQKKGFGGAESAMFLLKTHLEILKNKLEDKELFNEIELLQSKIKIAQDSTKSECK